MLHPPRTYQKTLLCDRLNVVVIVFITALVIKPLLPSSFSLIFSFFQESTLALTQAPSTISCCRCVWLQNVLVGAERRPCSSISTSRVLILAPVSWFGPWDSDHCSGQSHSCSIQPHHLPILTDYCIRTTKTKRNRKKISPQNHVFPKEILNVTRIFHQTGMVLKTISAKFLAVKWISNQKLDLTVVVREVFAICFGPIRGANLVILVSGLFL